MPHGQITADKNVTNQSDILARGCIALVFGCLLVSLTVKCSAMLLSSGIPSLVHKLAELDCCATLQAHCVSRLFKEDHRVRLDMSTLQSAFR